MSNAQFKATASFAVLSQYLTELHVSNMFKEALGLASKFDSNTITTTITREKSAKINQHPSDFFYQFLPSSRVPSKYLK